MITKITGVLNRVLDEEVRLQVEALYGVDQFDVVLV